MRVYIEYNTELIFEGNLGFVPEKEDIITLEGDDWIVERRKIEIVLNKDEAIEDTLIVLDVSKC